MSSNADVLEHAGYFAELVDEWALEGDPNERLFRLGTSVVAALAAGAPVLPVARYFEYWLLRLQGVYPSVGARLPAVWSELARARRTGHDVRTGVCVCTKCGSPDGGTRLSRPAIEFLPCGGDALAGGAG